MDVSEAKRAEAARTNAKLKKPLAEQMLDATANVGEPGPSANVNMDGRCLLPRLDRRRCHRAIDRGGFANQNLRGLYAPSRTPRAGVMNTLTVSICYPPQKRGLNVATTSAARSAPSFPRPS